MAESAAVPGVDPSRVNTREELAACLNGLRRRRGLSYEAMERAAAERRDRPGGSRLEPLGKSTVGEIVTGKRLPAKGKLLTFLAVCGVTPIDLAQWLAAWERARTSDLTRPADAVRVRGARPRLLGVHDAIHVEEAVPGELPVYVARDIDGAVRAELTANAQRGCFVLLIGGSSVGKTRTLYEAVLATLPDWWLVHPAGPAEIAALASAPPSRTVVWLDNLQRYLDGEYGLTSSTVEALLNAPDPVAIIGTIWPDQRTDRTAGLGHGGADPHAKQREVLGLAEVFRIDPDFSRAEKVRARAAADRDPRIKIALETTGYGLTQTLAAAPELVARWQDAETADPYAWAVLTAALDAARLGATAPLTTDFLQAAAPGYCTSRQRADAPDDWLELALDYATDKRKVHGAAAALDPAGAPKWGEPRMGQVTGYTAADYLIQHASQKRRFDCPPASFWDAAQRHLRDPVEVSHLAEQARFRLLYRYAIPLYRRNADHGDKRAAEQLADLLARRGDLGELRARADEGDGEAAWRLIALLAEHGQLDELRTRAGAGDRGAAERLADLLVRDGNPGDLDEARQIERSLAPDGPGYDYDRDYLYYWHVKKLLDAHEELARLRPLADAGDTDAAMRAARLLAEHGRHGEAMQILRPLAHAGDNYAADRLADLLAEHGHPDEAIQIWRPLAYAGDKGAAISLACLLAGREDLDGLRALADANPDPREVPNPQADMLLFDLLLEHGHLDELRARAQTSPIISSRLMGFGDPEHLRRSADEGFWWTASRLALLLAGRGDLDGLRARADAGDDEAAKQLSKQLARRGDRDELLARTGAGDKHAAARLPALVAKQGPNEEAERLRRFGLNPDGSIAIA